MIREIKLLLARIQNLKKSNPNKDSSDVHHGMTILANNLNEILNDEESVELLLKSQLNIQHNIITHRAGNIDENLVFNFIMRHNKVKEIKLLMSEVKIEKLGISNLRLLFQNPHFFPYVNVSHISLLYLFSRLENEIYDQHEKMYPIGSLFISAKNDNPEILFPGTKWDPLQGRFLMSASDYSTMNESLQIGGKETHLLTLDELPPHFHAINNLCTSLDGEHNHEGYCDFRLKDVEKVGTVAGNDNFIRVDTGINQNGPIFNWMHTHIFKTNRVDGHQHKVQGNTEETGGNKRFNLIPPYIKVFVWTRIK
ncbi:hypothetical protein TRFO_19296 [Tritrichomonas foetus]|uniref:Baseplate structural protein Gp10 C-terminal domain-containing protein n=1 Tax=Tritrichomonas foetus TaxID=1144522 RepID=A0A1J4KIY8_9EUKA|nr:hypothetical protein TRFO_19296 [Tritrichomonas foetus]|eukprot:OHT11313.1 hypothetical protein TRFO_19296 [Tritrichomonas foetus]